MFGLFLRNPLITIIGIAGLAGWATAGVQTYRYKDAVADLEATKVQVATDANRAHQAALDRLRKRHAEERQELEARLRAEREAVMMAQETNARLRSRLDTFSRDLEDLHDEPTVHDYLSLPVPHAVIGRLRVAQTGNRDEAGTD